MSLKQPPFKYIVNSIDANTVVVNGTTVTISPGNTAPIAFDSGDVIACSRVCAADCTPQVVEIEPVVPAEPCNCPFIFNFWLRPIPCPGQVGLIGEGNFNGGFSDYEVVLPSGVTPTIGQIVDRIVDQINSDPYRFVDAAKLNVGNTVETDPALMTSFRLTERNCDDEYSTGKIRRTCGFTYGGNSFAVGSVATAHASAVLTSNDAYREFPVGHGEFGIRADLTACGGYCKYYFRIRPSTPNAPAHMSDHGYITRETELVFLVNNTDADFAAMWDGELAAALDCLTALP